MRKYRVYLHKTTFYSLDVEATDEQAAMEIGLSEALAASEINSRLKVDDAVEIIDDDR